MLRADIQKYIVPLVLAALLLGACATTFAQGGKAYDAIPVTRPRTSAPQFPSPVTFTDITASSGIAFRHNASPTANKFLLETMGGGVAVFDYDNDGRPDIFFTNGARLNEKMPADAIPQKSEPKFWNRLFRQRADHTFEDVTEKAGVQGIGYSFGTAVGDYDDDGFSDLLVTEYGGTTLYHNNGNGTFSDVTAKLGIKVPGWPASAGFFDYDKDGRLDLFVTRYVEWDFKKGSLFCGDAAHGSRSYCHPDNFKATSSLLFHQKTDGTFEDVSERSGVAGSVGKALGVAFADIDDDGWVDIFVANDNVAQQLFHNLRNGKFEEIALPSGLAYDDKGKPFAGMGVDIEDYDGNGKPDVVITAFSGETYPLFRNAGGLFYDYVTGASGVGANTALGTGWGVKFADVDNDGKRDLLFAQGHISDNIERQTGFLKYKQPLLLLRGTGITFQNISDASGSIFKQGLSARGLASVDLDDDGDIDFVVAQTDGSPLILRNNGTGNHWIGMDLRGKSASAAGCGAKILITESSGRKQVFEVESAGSYLSTSDHRIVAGLGRAASVRSVEVRWPDGKIQKIERPAIDTYNSVRRN